MTEKKETLLEVSNLKTYFYTEDGARMPGSLPGAGKHW